VIITVKYIKREFLFVNEESQIIFTVPRSRISSGKMELVADEQTEAIVRVKSYEFWLLKMKYYLSYPPDRTVHLLEGKKYFNLHYNLNIGDNNYLIYPHTGENGYYVTVEIDGIQCARIKFDGYLTNNEYAQIELNKDANSKIICSIVMALYLNYEISHFTEFISYSGKEYKPFNRKWRVK